MENKSTHNIPSAKGAEQGKKVGMVAVELVELKPYRWRAWFFQAYLVVAMSIFGILFGLAGRFSFLPIDLSITRAIQSINVIWFASLMWWVSYFGYAPQIFFLVAIVILILVFVGMRWEAFITLVTIGGGSGLAELIKVIVQRPRPRANLITVLQQLNTYSFPSGHVLTYTAFFGFLFFLVYTLLRPSFARTFLLVFLGGFVALIGISRVYVGDHWASDVIAAYLLGSLWLALCIRIYRRGKIYFYSKQFRKAL